MSETDKPVWLEGECERERFILDLVARAAARCFEPLQSQASPGLKANTQQRNAELARQLWRFAAQVYDSKPEDL
jgi:hypothetical protein